MTSLPAFLAIGFVTGQLLRQGSPGLALALGLATGWLIVSHQLRLEKVRGFPDEIKSILKEKGYI